MLDADYESIKYYVFNILSRHDFCILLASRTDRYDDKMSGYRTVRTTSLSAIGASHTFASSRQNEELRRFMDAAHQAGDYL
jgi:hypothetical protein